MKIRICTLPILFILSVILMSGCAQHMRIQGYSTSENFENFIDLVKDSRLADIKKPLQLPASIAVVFIPSDNRNNYYLPRTTLHLAAEQLKQQLIANPKFVRSVIVVPTKDLKTKLSLQKIRALYGTDIVILLSYQQDFRSQQSGPAAFMDLTVVGYFFVPGVEIQTSTLVEGKVIHIPNDALIVTVNGSDQRSSYFTSYGVKNASVDESIESIIAATRKLGDSLINVQTQFENYDFSRAVPLSDIAASESINNKGKPSNDYWKKVNAYKSSGGGTFGIILVMISIASCYLARRKK